MRPAGLAAVLAGTIVALGSCNGGDGNRPAPLVSAEAFKPTPAEPPPSLRPGALEIARGRVIGAVDATGARIAWQDGALEGEGAPANLFQRTLPRGRARKIATGVAPSYGVAATSGWVVAAEEKPGQRPRLFAVRPDGSGRTVLSRSLAAPIASRGEVVAWIEQPGRRQRVVVRDMSKGVQWIAAAPRPCERGRCYQLGAVQVADAGVVFTRQTSGPDAAYIVRRRFDERRTARVSIPKDPQPDLAASSRGALYYALGRGWYRWDFDRPRPRRAGFSADRPPQIQAFEDGRYLILTSRGCRFGMVAARPRGRPTQVAPAGRMRALAGADRSACVELGAASWTGRQLLSGWGVLSEGEGKALEELVTGVLFASDPL